MRRGTFDRVREKAAREGLQAALDAGRSILSSKGKAIDAVEASARVLEDNPCFNAGRGSSLNRDGFAELDAAIMEGHDRNAGAVAALRTTRAPIQAARLIMDQSPHVFLVGEDAEKFVKKHGLEQVENSWFVTDERKAVLKELLGKKEEAFDTDIKYGTIGAVALDEYGNVAAATSTGGLTGKNFGRLGDSPLIGCGTYADNRAAAVSATGLGEIFIRGVAAYDVCARMRYRGEKLQNALDAVIGELLEMGGKGGLIGVSPSGEVAWSFTTPSMYRAKASSHDKAIVSIYGEEA